MLLTQLGPDHPLAADAARLVTELKRTPQPQPEVPPAPPCHSPPRTPSPRPPTLARRLPPPQNLPHLINPVSLPFPFCRSLPLALAQVFVLGSLADGARGVGSRACRRFPGRKEWHVCLLHGSRPYGLRARLELRRGRSPCTLGWGKCSGCTPMRRAVRRCLGHHWRTCCGRHQWLRWRRAATPTRSVMSRRRCSGGGGDEAGTHGHFLPTMIMTSAPGTSKYYCRPNRGAPEPAR